MRHQEHDYDLYGDIAKIKRALADATLDAKGLATEYVTQSIEDMKDKSDKVQHDISHYVAKKPVKSLGIALLTGLAIGYLFRRK